jgi:ATP-dependent exoDNAse (exonuclease V) alpha subunit
VRRQRARWDREALGQLRDGDIEAFTRAYADHGRLVAAPSTDAARAAIVQDWWMAHQSGAASLMLAHRRSDVRDLNDRARERMRAAGRLGPDELTAAGRAFAVGEQVVTTRNDRNQELVNGQRGEIVGIDQACLSVRFDGGAIRQVSRAYAEAGHLDHGYATTAHRAQGATVDQTFVLGSDELYREWGYTALSRHRQSARFYVTAAREFLNAPAAPLEAGPDASRRVAALLAISRAKRLGIEPEAATWSHPERPVLRLPQDPLRRISPDLGRSRGLEL